MNTIDFSSATITDLSNGEKRIQFTYLGNSIDQVIQVQVPCQIRFDPNWRVFFSSQIDSDTASTILFSEILS